MSVEILLIPIAIAAVGAIKASNNENQEASDLISIKTKIKDAKLLEKSLKIYGCKNVSMGEILETEINQSRIIFEKDENNIFNAIFIGNISLEDANEFILGVNEEYTKLVQEQVYKKLLKNADNYNLRLESEEVKKDNSIVLTFALPEEK